MALYTVHLPEHADQLSREQLGDRTVIVREGFHFWAFLAPLIWLIVRRAWLALVLYLLTSIVIGVIAGLTHNTSTGGTALLLLSVLVGFEAPAIRQRVLRRRGFTDAGTVMASNVDEAARIFFSRAPAASVAETPASAAPASDMPDVLGVFPKPAASR